MHGNRCILHIGMQKTGSSYIQHFLDINSEALSALGWDYPTFGRMDEGKPKINHRYLAWSFSNPSRTNITREDVKKFVPDHENFIISCESFWQCSQDEVVSDMVDLWPARTSVVCFLRHPSSLMSSLYNQSIKSLSSVNVSSFHEFLAKHTSILNKETGFSPFAFDRNISVWRKYFQDIITLSYTRGGSETEVIENFFKAVGIPFERSAFKFPDMADGTRYNQSISQESAAIMRRLNAMRMENSIGEMDWRAYKRFVINNDGKIKKIFSALIKYEKVSLEEFLEMFEKKNPIHGLYGSEEFLSRNNLIETASVGINMNDKEIVQRIMTMIEKYPTNRSPAGGREYA